MPLLVVSTFERAEETNTMTVLLRGMDLPAGVIEKDGADASCVDRAVSLIISI